MELIVQINDCINSIVWGVPTLVLIFFIGLYFTIRLRFFQFVHPAFFIKETFMKSYKEIKPRTDMVRYPLSKQQ